MARSSIATDNFNRATLDANWAQLNTANGSITIYNNVDISGSTTGNAGARAGARWVGAGAFTDDQYAVLAITALPWLSSEYAIGVICRASADTGANRDWYEFMVQADSSGPNYTTTLARIVNGTYTQLNSEQVAWSVGDTIELEVTGQSPNITVTAMRNGVALGGSFTVTGEDQTNLDSGVPGVSGSGGDNCTGDDWIGGNIVSDALEVTGHSFSSMRAVA